MRCPDCGKWMDEIAHPDYWCSNCESKVRV